MMLEIYGVGNSVWLMLLVTPGFLKFCEFFVFCSFAFVCVLFWFTLLVVYWFDCYWFELGCFGGYFELCV